MPLFVEVYLQWFLRYGCVYVLILLVNLKLWVFTHEKWEKMEILVEMMIQAEKKKDLGRGKNIFRQEKKIKLEKKCISLGKFTVEDP